MFTLYSKYAIVQTFKKKSERNKLKKTFKRMVVEIRGLKLQRSYFEKSDQVRETQLLKMILKELRKYTER